MLQRLGSITIVAIWTVSSVCFAEPGDPKSESKQYLYPSISGTVLRPEEPPGIELTDRGRNIRGVYAPVSKLVKWQPRQLISWVKEIGADAIIMDIKDDKGRVTYSHKIEGALGKPHGIVPKMKRLVKALKENDIYVIGRLVCFKDDLYHKKRPEASIRDRRDGTVWRDRAGMAWLDPFSLAAHEYITNIAIGAEEIGFDEIQLDYVRFPVDGLSRYARFPNKEKGMARYEAIALLLARVDVALKLPLSIDVFGLTAHRTGDKQGLGQSLEHLSPYIDAISPMLYVANWPKETYEDPDPKKNYSLVHGSVKRIRSRLSDTVAVRPLLQGFSYRATNFGVEFISNQIDAAKTAGASGYLFWNQSGNYTTVSVSWRRLGIRSRTEEIAQEKSNEGHESAEMEQEINEECIETAESDTEIEVAANTP